MGKDKKLVEAITSMETDFAQWYTDVVKKAELCDYASVKGCMVIKPAGYAIWENIQKELDRRFKETGVENVYMPMFIPEGLLQKEKDHVEGFAPEVAWVTHGGLEPLQERLCVRPTSETLFCDFYAGDIHSYRDLPLRYGETSTLFRNEDSGEMHGLTRVRQFTISEGHLIVRPDQMVEEFKKCLALAKHCLQTLGVEEDVTYHLSKWDPDNREKYIGEPQVWEETQQHMRDIMKELQIPYVEDVGEAAFYGPKIDINARNVYGKEDTMITIQWDALLAEQFDMYFIDQNGDKVRPYIIHRTSMGCYERTLAWLVEKYAGKFPTWLCPEQVRILPISEKYEAYAQSVRGELKKNGVLAEVDGRSEKIGFKIREARLAKVPYMLVVGEQEEAGALVSVRSRFAGDEGQKPLAEFIGQICEEIRTRAIRKEEVPEEK